MVARESLWGHPGHQKRHQSTQNTNILHKYFAHRFQRASWPALWQKPGQNYMSETMFGLRRRERIAGWPFYKKKCLGATFLTDFGVVLGAKSSHLGHFGPTMALFFGAGCGLVVRVMEIAGPHPRLKSGRGSKSI